VFEAALDGAAVLDSEVAFGKKEDGCGAAFARCVGATASPRFAANADPTVDGRGRGMGIEDSARKDEPAVSAGSDAVAVGNDEVASAVGGLGLGNGIPDAYAGCAAFVGPVSRC
jgi:hypothetical protein